MYSDRYPTRSSPPNPVHHFSNQLFSKHSCLNQHCSNPLCTNKLYSNPPYPNQSFPNQPYPNQPFTKESYPKESFSKEMYPREPPYPYQTSRFCSAFNPNQLPRRTSHVYSTQVYPAQVMTPQLQSPPPPPPPRKTLPHPLARCRLCNEEIPFTVGNPVELGFHMIDRHSSGSVVQYSIHEEDKICPSRKASGGAPAADRGVNTGGVGGGGGVPAGICPGPCRNIEGFSGKKRHNEWDGSVRRMHSGGRRRYKSRKGKGLYKTTLETWTAGGCYMVCPTCKKEVKPLIRSQKNKVAYTSLGATFLLSCWPFCFLFPLHHKCSVDLYCPQCKQKLGVYDTTTGTYQTSGNVLVRSEQVPNISRSRH